MQTPIAVHSNGAGVNGVHAAKLWENWQSGSPAGEQEICLRCGSPFDPAFRHRCALREFDLSDLRVLARETCTRCHGTGVWRWKRPSRAGVRAYLGRFRGFRPEPVNGLIDQSKAAPVPCRCTLRKVFRDCLHRCHRISAQRDPRRDWWRKAESYRTDFYLIAKRELHRRQLAHSHTLIERSLFRLHFLQGVDCNGYTAALGIPKLLPQVGKLLKQHS